MHCKVLFSEEFTQRLTNKWICRKNTVVYQDADNAKLTKA